MARIYVNIYKNSVLASILSIVGTVFLLLNVGMFISELVKGSFDFAKDFPVVILYTLIAILLLWLAKYISERKEFKQFVKYVKQNHLEQEIAGSIEAALKLYRAYPTKLVKKYITKLNPETLGMLETRK